MAIVIGTATAMLCVYLQNIGVQYTVLTITVLGVMLIAASAFCQMSSARRTIVSKPYKQDGVIILHQEDWVARKVITIAWVLATMSACTFFNFALALLVTTALAPVAILCAPSQTHSTRRLVASALCILPLIWIFTIAHLANSSPLDAMGLLAEHNARWHTFALPVTFGIVMPTLLLSASVITATLIKEKQT
jgi:hypothetical protein